MNEKEKRNRKKGNERDKRRAEGSKM